MRVFLDACIDPRTTAVFAGHDVRTAYELGWHQLKDNVLLPKVAEQGIVIVHVAKNKVEFYRSLASELLTAVREVRAGTVRHVPAGE